MRRRLALAAALVPFTLVLGCAADGPGSPTPSGRTTEPSATGSPSVDPAQVTSTWGPTLAEIQQAQELVADWTPEQLAGQVIVGRFHGTDAAAAQQMVTDLHLAGMSVTTGNVVDEAQVREFTAAIEAGVAADGRDFPAVVGVDQEGGYVSHLRGVATEFPAFDAAGTAIERDVRRGRDVTREAARTTALEARDLGFTWIFAPVADVTIGWADPTIGSRSPSTDPATASRAIAAAVRGYADGAVVSTTKHFPGHGAATSDSHDTLPVLEATREELAARDLVPFEGAIRSGAPAVMMSHLDVPAIEAGVPASLSEPMYDLLRDDLGFEGVAITDSLGMGAVAGIERPAVRALQAGADLVLMPVDNVVTHQVITDAIISGDITRERIEEAAARVVALQMSQQRRAAVRPVPEDIATLAQEASAALSAAAWQ